MYTASTCSCDTKEFKPGIYLGGFSDKAGCVVDHQQHVLLRDEGPVLYVSPPESSRQCSPVCFVTFSETLMDHPNYCEGVRTCRSMIETTLEQASILVRNQWGGLWTYTIS